MIAIGFLFRKKKSIVNEEPRISTIRIQQSTYGVGIPLVYGTDRISYNLIQYEDFTAIQHTDTQKIGGKGGKKATNTTITYTYTAALAMSLCEGEIKSVNKVWYDKQKSTIEALGMELFNGKSGQTPWLYMQSRHPERAMPYSNTAYLAGTIDLGSDAQIPNFSFEVSTEDEPLFIPWTPKFDNYNGVKFHKNGQDLYVLLFGRYGGHNGLNSDVKSEIRKYDPETGMFVKFLTFSDYDFDSIYSLGERFFVYGSQGKAYEVYRDVTFDYDLTGLSYMNMFSVGDNVYIASYWEIYKLENGSLIKIIDYCPTPVGFICESNGTVFLFGSNGYFTFDGVSANNFTEIHDVYYPTGAIQHNGEIFISSQYYGMFKLNGNTAINYMQNSEIASMQIYDNSLFCSKTNGDIYKYDGSDFIKVLNPNEPIDYHKGSGMNSMVEYNGLMYMSECGFTYNTGYNLWAYDKNTNKADLIIRESSSSPSAFIGVFAGWNDSLYRADGKIIFKYSNGKWIPDLKFDINPSRLWSLNNKLYIVCGDGSILYSWNGFILTFEHTFNAPISDMFIYESKIHVVTSIYTNSEAYFLFAKELDGSWLQVPINMNCNVYSEIMQAMVWNNAVYFTSGGGGLFRLEQGTLYEMQGAGQYMVVFNNQLYISSGNSFATSKVVLPDLNVVSTSLPFFSSAAVYNGVLFSSGGANYNLYTTYAEGDTRIENKYQVPNTTTTKLTGFYSYKGKIAASDSEGAGTFVMEEESKPVGGDAIPYRVIKDLVTNKVKGVGLDESIFNPDNIKDYYLYCKENNFEISIAILESRECREIIKEICMATNSTAFLSNGTIKILPFLDNLQPVFALNVDHFVFSSDDPPISIERIPTSEIHNSIGIEFSNRETDYAIDTVEAQDQASIDVYGLNKSEPAKLSCIKKRDMAFKIANIALQREQNIRNRYKFRLPLNFMFLSNMDIVTITDEEIGLINVPVRITEMNTDRKSGIIEFNSEDYVTNNSTVTDLVIDNPSDISIDMNSEAGSIELFKILEPPYEISKSTTLEIWGAASSSNPNWGGCNVHVSWDDTTYKYVTTLQGKSRLGTLMQGITAENGIDQINHLNLDLTKSLSEIVSLSDADFNNNESVSIINDEYFAYKNSVLISKNKYDVSYLNRGLYGSQPSIHNQDSIFLKLSGSLFKQPIKESDIGKKIYIKLTSFNVFGQAEEDISTVDPIEYIITGNGLRYAPKNISSIWLFGSFGINWTPIVDTRDISYEIRMGNDFDTATVITTTKQSSYTVEEAGNYFVVPVYQGLYSDIKTSILIEP